jgi:uncharacterized protein YkwD
MESGSWKEDEMVVNIARKFLLLLVLGAALLVAAGCSNKTSKGGSGSDAVLQLAELINNERDSRGVGRLTWDGAIAGVEQAHAQWLADHAPAPYTWPYHEEGVDDKLFPARLDDAGVTYATAQEWGVSTTTLTNAGLVFAQLPDWVFDANWDRFGFGYVKPPGRETGNQYWVLGFVED